MRLMWQLSTAAMSVCMAHNGLGLADVPAVANRQPKFITKVQ